MNRPHALFWVLGILAAFHPLDGFAEGSCTWEEARAILEQSPELLAHVEQTLTVDPTGFALRLGAHYTDLSGQRVAPFTFRAVSRSSPAVALELVVQAELTFFDHEGKAVTSEQSSRAHQVRQTLTGITLRPLLDSALPEANAETLNQRTAWIREQSTAVQAASLSSTAIPFPPQKSPYAGEARLLRDPAAKNTVRSILVHATRVEDGRSCFEERYDFANGELFLVSRRESNWIMHPENPNRSINRVAETSYYFLEGAVYQAMEKRYEAEDPALLDRAAQEAAEQRIALSGAESMQLLSKASRLSIVKTPAALLAVYAPEP